MDNLKNIIIKYNIWVILKDKVDGIDLCLYFAVVAAKIKLKKLKNGLTECKISWG